MMEASILDRRYCEGWSLPGDKTGSRLAAGNQNRLISLRQLSLPRRRTVPVVVVMLLAVHASLLAFSTTWHSPTFDEPGHLVAGISYWEFGRFDVYRVNPPLTRLVAALPVLAAGYEMDWSRFYDGPGARPEFALGEDFIKANGERLIRLFTIARWACIPFSLIGGLFCFLWGRELYGTLAGLAALALWCFDPNVLAHGELITPDAAASAFGIGAGYTFWRWLKRPGWDRAALAGLPLGLAELSKMSWLFLFGLWPLLWLFWQASGGHQPSEPSKRRQAAQLAAILAAGLFLLNAGYDFDGSFTPLGRFTFVSETFAGERDAGGGGNRFADSWLGRLPVPVPKQYLLGLDTQKRDFEDSRRPSYLRGEWREGGWWHYYLFGLAVKVPHGTQLLFLLAVGLTILKASGRRRPAESPGPSISWRDELILFAPAVCLFALVSSQTEFSHHFRYVLPSSGVLLIFLAKPFFLWIGRFRSVSSWSAVPVLASLLLAASIISSLRVYPHSLAYFNELAGGPSRGWRHMSHSSLDWGQDLLLLKQRLAERRPAVPPRLIGSYSYDPRDLGLDVEHLTAGAHPDGFDRDAARHPRGAVIHSACRSHSLERSRVVLGAVLPCSRNSCLTRRTQDLLTQSSMAISWVAIPPASASKTSRRISRE